jgi:hypothetical protein
MHSCRQNICCSDGAGHSGPVRETVCKRSITRTSGRRRATPDSSTTRLPPLGHWYTPRPIPVPPRCRSSGFMLGWISSRIGTRRIARRTLLHLCRRCTSVVLPRYSPFPSGARVGMQVRVVAPLQHLRVAPHLPLPQRCFPSPSGCRPRQTSPLPPRRSRPACSLRPYTTPAPVPLASPIRRRARHRATL